jgi:hypothetical protein
MQLQLFITLISALFLTAGCKKEKGEELTSNTPRTSITSELAGKKWLSQGDLNISTDPNYYTLTVYNPSTKKWFNSERDPWDMRPRPANGIRFTPDGDFEICKFTDFGTGGLRSYTFWYMKGTAEQNGFSIKLHPTSHQTTYYSTSDPSLNYDKALERTPVTLIYTIRSVGSGWNELEIKWSDGTYSYFYSKQ